MSTGEVIFQRPAGAGWLVLAGRPPRLEAEVPGLVESLLERGDPTAPPLMVEMPGAEAEGLGPLRRDLEILLEMPTQSAQVDMVEGDMIAQAGLIVLSGGDPGDWLAALSLEAREAVLMGALMGNRIVLASDSAAATLGEWVLLGEKEDPLPGQGWLKGGVILPAVEDPASWPGVRDLLGQPEKLYSLGLGGHGVLALGPAGEVEIWSTYAPSILLSQGWRRESDV